VFIEACAFVVAAVIYLREQLITAAYFTGGSSAEESGVAAQVVPLISELGRTRMQVNTKVKAGFGAKIFALNVVITIPVPDTTAKADIHTSIGEPSHPGCAAVSAWSLCSLSAECFERSICHLVFPSFG